MVHKTMLCHACHVLVYYLKFLFFASLPSSSTHTMAPLLILLWRLLLSEPFR